MKYQEGQGDQFFYSYQYDADNEGGVKQVPTAMD